MGFDNVVSLPHATDVEVLHGTDRSGRSDVSILGSTYGYRVFWIRRMASRGLTVQVWGGRVRGIAKVRSRRVQAVGANQGRAFRTGTVVLNTQNPLDIAGANQTLFDAAAAGVAQLTEERPDSSRHLGRDCVAMFRNADEFDAELDRLLNDRPYRESLAQRARTVVAEHHTYEHRLTTLAKLLWG